MKKHAAAIKCLSIKGERLLPTIEEVKNIREQNINPVIFIDSCVCLHIVKAVDYGKKATNVNIHRIIQLKEYLSKNEIRLNAVFGLSELCLKDGVFNNEKFYDLLYRIHFFEQIPIKQFKEFKYNFDDYIIIRDSPERKLNPYIAFEPPLMNTYCSLLKIRSIAKLRPNKIYANENLGDFFNFMVKKLDIVRGSEYQLAFKIFMGKTEFRKMIGLDSKEEEAKKKLFSTSWDLFHSKSLTNSFRIFQMLQENIIPFFITFDRNLFELHKNISITFVKEGGEEITSSFLMNTENEYNESEAEIERKNRIMLDTFISRRSKKLIFKKDRVKKLIKNLEVENNFTTFTNW